MKRTESEIKANVDGYNACFNQFMECIKHRKSIHDVVNKMMVMRKAVINVVEKVDGK